jgi:hypothetical protein
MGLADARRDVEPREQGEEVHGDPEVATPVDLLHEEISRGRA